MATPIPLVCPYCGVGCNLELSLDERDRPFKSRAAGRNPELNGKYLCVKGITIHELLNHEERLSQPFIRKADKLELVSWEEAVNAAAGGLKDIIAKYGPESVGMLCSGKILNEEVYLSQKFQKPSQESALKSPFCCRSTVYFPPTEQPLKTVPKQCQPAPPDACL